MASPKQNASTGGNIYTETASMDNTQGSSRRKSSPLTQSRKRMVSSSPNLVCNKSRKSSSPGNRNISFRPLEKITRFRGIRTSLENWQGNWLKEKLSIGERYWISRIRVGLSQNEAARQLEISRSSYQQLESRKDDLRLFKITDFEWCRIMRRRVGWKQHEVASKMGSSRIWVNRMEAGQESCDPLLWFWEQ